MGSGNGGGGFFNQIADFFSGGFQSQVQGAIQEAQVGFEAQKAQRQVEERDRKDKATKVRDEDRARQKAAAAVGQGRAGTILTSPLGEVGSVGDSAMTGGKTLLGS